MQKEIVKIEESDVRVETTVVVSIDCTEVRNSMLENTFFTETLKSELGITDKAVIENYANDFRNALVFQGTFQETIGDLAIMSRIQEELSSDPDIESVTTLGAASKCFKIVSTVLDVDEIVDIVDDIILEIVRDLEPMVDRYLVSL